MRQQDANALRLKLLQSGGQLGMRLLRHGHAQDAGELSGHARHPALQPVAAVIGDALGQSFDQTWLIFGNDGKNEVIHGRLLCWEFAHAVATAH